MNDFGRSALTSIVLLALSWQPVFAASQSAVQAALVAGDYAGALDIVEERLGTQPREPELLFIKALTLTMLDRWDDASLIFKQLARNYPQLPEPANNLAVIQARRGDYRAAQQTLHKLLERHPSYAPAHENLGDVLTAQAEAQYRRALELGTADATLRGKLGMLKSLNGLPSTREDSDFSPASPSAPVAQPGFLAMQSTPGDAKQVEEIRAVLEGWRANWMDGRVERYLAYYSSDFVPPRRLTRTQWEKQRRVRVVPERRAQITLSDVRMDFRGDELVTLVLRQDYRSPRYTDSVIKKIQLRREDGVWKILREFIPQ